MIGQEIFGNFPQQPALQVHEVAAAEAMLFLDRDHEIGPEQIFIAAQEKRELL
jgi:hypothetical protein